MMCHVCLTTELHDVLFIQCKATTRGTTGSDYQGPIEISDLAQILNCLYIWGQLFEINDVAS